jgi:hypothetical protein
MWIFSLLVFLCLGAYWCYQFIQLMMLSDSEFPGEYDKVLWVVAFVFMCPFTPFAFHAWKTAYDSMVSTRDRSPGKPRTPGSGAG